MKTKVQKGAVVEKWDKGGYHYSQQIAITLREYEQLQDMIRLEIEQDYPHRKDYTFTSGMQTALVKLVKRNGTVFLNLTQARYVAKKLSVEIDNGVNSYLSVRS